MTHEDDGDRPTGVGHSTNPSLDARYHRHATGADNHEPDAVHPQRPAGTPPPPRNPHRTRNLILSAVGMLAALAVVIGVVAAVSGRSSTPEAGPTATTYERPPRPAECTEGVPAEKAPAAGLDLGDVLIPAASLPRGWQTSREVLPVAAAAQLVSGPVEAAPTPASTTGPKPSGRPAPQPTGPPLVGVLTLDKAAPEDLRAAGDLFLKCLAYLPRYDGLEALPAVVTATQADVTSNGVDYVHLAARLTTGRGADRGGDAIYAVVIGTQPRSIAVGIAPLADAAAQEKVREALGAVQIRAPS